MIETERSDIPEEVTSWIGERRYLETAQIAVEESCMLSSCASVKNSNIVYWNANKAMAICGKRIAPPSMISVWLRPHYWSPGTAEGGQSLKTHYDLKNQFDLPEGIITDNELTFYEPAVVGDVLNTYQVLKSVSDPKTIKLGVGRFWVIDSIIENDRGELCAVDRYTGLGYIKR